MSMLNLNSKLGLFAALAIAGSAGACKTVSPDEMDASLSALRAEMQGEMAAGDTDLRSDMDGRFADVDRRFAALEQELQQMEREFEVSIARLEDELRFNVPVYFGFDDATVEEEDEHVLARFGSVAQKYYPNAQITVEGFTDPSGDENYNLWLGEQRANAVAAYLVEGTALTEDRVKAVSYGEDTRRLVSSGWGPGVDGWENRRVVLVIDHDGAPPMTATEQEGPSTEG
ncbi:MAG: OmpA family protein [Longimicrobiales bacterium]|jgi:peptidoglycan-associated lipoprotein|nr:OmpA family protein [Longimicrobiales bacterium]